MRDPIDPEFEAGGRDPEETLWVRGVGYLEGWQDAADAIAALRQALDAAGLELAGARLRPRAAADGSGIVRCEFSADQVREVARLLAGARWRRAG